MVVGVCRISLQLEDCQSLKDKRSVLRRIKDRVNQKWSCAIAEVGDLEDFQNAQPGKYQVKDSLVIFTPDTVFKKGQTYFIRSYQYGEIRDAWQYIRQKSQTNSLSYKDLHFRY